MENKAFVISVLSGKGGVGKTIISSNLAYIIAERYGYKTLLIDANITSSHISSVMKIPTIINVNQLLSGGKIDLSKIPTYGNLHVLPAKVFVGKRDYTNVINLKKIVNKFRKFYDVIVIDSAPGIGREAIAAIEAADTCLIVTTPFSTSIADVLRVKDVLKELKEKRSKLLVNMVEKKFYEIKEDEIKFITGMPIIASIPYDDNAMDAVATGDLVAKIRPWSTFVKTLDKVAYDILSEEFYVVESKLSTWQKVWLKFRELLA